MRKERGAMRGWPRCGSPMVRVSTSKDRRVTGVTGALGRSLELERDREEVKESLASSDKEESSLDML